MDVQTTVLARHGRTRRSAICRLRKQGTEARCTEARVRLSDLHNGCAIRLCCLEYERAVHCSDAITRCVLPKLWEARSIALTPAELCPCIEQPPSGILSTVMITFDLGNV